MATAYNNPCEAMEAGCCMNCGSELDQPGHLCTTCSEENRQYAEKHIMNRPIATVANALAAISVDNEWPVL